MVALVAAVTTGLIIGWGVKSSLDSYMTRHDTSYKRSWNPTAIGIGNLIDGYATARRRKERPFFVYGFPIWIVFLVGVAVVIMLVTGQTK